MAVYEVFAQPELRRYKTHVCSKASLIMVVMLFATLIPPLFVVYRSYGFWIKEAYYRETPEVHFKKELLYVVELEGADGQYLTYSTFPRYNQLQQANLRVPLIQSRELDENGDGKPDGLIFKMEMPVQDTERVTGVKLLLFFEYMLERYSTMIMEAMTYIHYDSIRPGASYDVFGDLRIHQRAPIAHRGFDNRYNASIINTTSMFAEAYKFSTIFKAYSGRNVSTVLDAPYTFWTSGRGSGQPFVLNANISYVEDVFLYTPSFWYMIKWGWIQYVSVLLLFIFAFHRIQIFIYENQLVTTMVSRPWKTEKVL